MLEGPSVVSVRAAEERVWMEDGSFGLQMDVFI